MNGFVAEANRWVQLLVSFSPPSKV